tara:strand:+ start:2937 stop:3281 length:345 start_codon:yes stop_codon:yes gene_type:complete
VHSRRKWFFSAEPVFRNDADVTSLRQRLGHWSKDSGSPVLPSPTEIDDNGRKGALPLFGTVEIQGKAPALIPVDMGELKVSFSHDSLMHIGPDTRAIRHLRLYREAKNCDGRDD